MTDNDGGPAFPVTFQHEDVDVPVSIQEWQGTSLRDYFAAKSMQSSVLKHMAV